MKKEVFKIRKEPKHPGYKNYKYYLYLDGSDYLSYADKPFYILLRDNFTEIVKSLSIHTTDHDVALVTSSAEEFIKHLEIHAVITYDEIDYDFILHIPPTQEYKNKIDKSFDIHLKQYLSWAESNKKNIENELQRRSDEKKNKHIKDTKKRRLELLAKKALLEKELNNLI